MAKVEVREFRKGPGDKLDQVTEIEVDANGIELFEAKIDILHDRCIDCDLCVWICPIEVLHTDKAEMISA